MNKKIKLNLYDISDIALSISFLILCSFISIPLFNGFISFTLQLFAIFLIIYCFSFIKSFLSIFIYELIGLTGIPVFSNFTGGISVFLGPTGGFLIGFLLLPLIFFILYKIIRNKNISYAIFIFFSLLILYLIGNAWFTFIYKNSSINFYNSLFITTFPFIIPDLFKGFLALIIGHKITPIIYKKRSEKNFN